MLSEFIYESAPFPSCHASTIVETGGELLAAWFGGTGEKHPDVGIWFSRLEQGKWTPPAELVNGVMGEGQRYPCWNPVFFQPARGPLMLFYKVGLSPDTWWGMLITSTDQGKTWSQPLRLPAGILGPIKNKPVQLEGGRILSPSSTEDQGWRVHFEFSDDNGKTWKSTPPINDGKTFGAIQPSILIHPEGRLQAVCRSRQGRITQSWCSDKGQSWSEMTATSLPNPNSGIDAVTLRSGWHLMVYNHAALSPLRSAGARSPLNVAVSKDGIAWQAALVLEAQPGEYSYPAVIQGQDGRVHITYTWKRKRIKYVVLDPDRLSMIPMKDGIWPKP